MLNFTAPIGIILDSSDPRLFPKLARGVLTILISVLLTPVLVGILGWLMVGGYGLRFLDNVRQGVSEPLPEWDQTGDDLGRGFRLLVVSLVWNLPGMILLSTATYANFSTLTTDLPDASFSVSSPAVTAFYFLYAIFVALMAPGYTIAVARPGSSIADGLRFGVIVSWSFARIGSVILALLAALVAGFIMTVAASIIGTVALVIGLVVTLPLGWLFSLLYTNHMYAQLAMANTFGGDAPAEQSGNDSSPALT